METLEKFHEKSSGNSWRKYMKIRDFFFSFFEQLRKTSPNYPELAISMKIPEVSWKFMENVRTGNVSWSIMHLSVNLSH
jgi:hypothetical protein